MLGSRVLFLLLRLMKAMHMGLYDDDTFGAHTHCWPVMAGVCGHACFTTQQYKQLAHCLQPGDCRTGRLSRLMQAALVLGPAGLACCSQLL